MTDRRPLCRFVSGRLTSLWWSGVVGMSVDRALEFTVFDFGDGQPLNLSGVQVSLVAPQRSTPP